VISQFLNKILLAAALIVTLRIAQFLYLFLVYKVDIVSNTFMFWFNRDTVHELTPALPLKILNLAFRVRREYYHAVAAKVWIEEF